MSSSETGARPATSDGLLGRARRWSSLLALLAAASWLSWNLDAGSLVDSDDALYAQMAREAVRSGDWLTFTYHDTPVFEKPPLALWALATSQALFGEGEAALRLPALLASLALLAVTWRVTRRLAPGVSGVGALAVLILAGSWTFTFHARGSMTDPLFVLCGTGALLAALAARQRPAAAPWVGLLLGLAALTKWVMAGVFVPPVLLALVGPGASPRLPWRKLALIAGLALLVPLPWVLHQTVTHGAAFWHDLGWYHVVNRARSPLVGEIGLTDAVADLFEREGPLALAWLAGLLALVRWPLLAVWAGAALAPFLLAATHLLHYVLPALPALAVAAALVLARTLRRAWPLAALVGLALAAWTTAPLIRSPDFSPDEERFGADVRALGAQVGAALVYDAHDVAISWYAGRPFRLLCRDPKLYGILKGIPILARPGLALPPETPLAEAASKTRRTAVLVPLPFQERFEAEARTAGLTWTWTPGRRYGLALASP
jgi:4-amino-4-deoxy-L-arabinose transferase-like glycosyltransferase